MNAKEEVILELNARIAYYENYKRRYLGDAAHAEKQINLFKSLITAVENAIFDVPSDMFSKRDVERAIFEFANGDRNLSEIERRDIAINFIINKKTESDGKD